MSFRIQMFFLQMQIFELRNFDFQHPLIWILLLIGSTGSSDFEINSIDPCFEILALCIESCQIIIVFNKIIII